MPAIRLLEPSDAEELTALLTRNDEFLLPFDPERPPGFLSVEGQRARLEEAQSRRAAGTAYLYAILDGGAIAGTISLSNVVRGPFQNASVGYWVDRDRNGRGLASRAVAAVVAEAFGPLGLHRLEAGTLVDNIASQRVLEKNGFTRIGVAPRYLRIAGAWRDHVLFQRTVEDRAGGRSAR